MNAILKRAIITGLVAAGITVTVLMQSKVNPQEARLESPGPSTNSLAKKSDDVTLRLVQSPHSDQSTRSLEFEISNENNSPLTCPDYWFIELENGSITNISLLRVFDPLHIRNSALLGSFGNVNVGPRETIRLAIADLGFTNAWRLGAGYYMEDHLFKAKVALQNHLPPTMSGVRSLSVFSDWIK